MAMHWFIPLFMWMHEQWRWARAEKRVNAALTKIFAKHPASERRNYAKRSKVRSPPPTGSGMEET
jgi:hypothetical protein